MSEAQVGNWKLAWRTRAYRALLATLAVGLVCALLTVPIPAALAGSNSQSASHLELAQAPSALRVAVLRTLHMRPEGVHLPRIQPGPAYEGFGQSIAISGRTALVGAIGVNNIAGAVYVYVHTGTSWVLQAVLTDPRNVPADFFGWSVALSGNTALIGSTGPDYYSGLAYVYGRSGSHWTLEARLASPHGVLYHSFGYSVALAGSTAVIGAYGSSTAPGAAYVYLHSAGRWHLQASLADPEQTSGGHFGLSVAVSGSTAVIGAPGANDDQGAAYVYARSRARWHLRASLADPASTSSDAFGSVAISGATILVGAPGTRATGKKAGTGEAYIYLPSRAGWTLRATLTGPAGVLGHFGNAVAFSGATAVVGASATDRGVGAAFVYVRSGSRWHRQAWLTSPDARDFGLSVAVSGSTAVIGAPGDNLSAGAAYAYARSGTRWGSRRALVDPRGIPGNETGAAVAISGTIAVVGSWGARRSRGAVDIYAESRNRWPRQATLEDPGGDAYDSFGAAVAVSGSTAVIGAYGVHTGNGAVYIYVRSGGRWRRQAAIVCHSYAAFGASVALSGSTVVIGAPGADKLDGAVYVYVRSRRQWHEQAMLPGPRGAAGNFGEAVAVSGDTVLVGASSANDYAGSAYIYARSGETWREQAALEDPVGVPNDGFGTSVALSGSTAVIGAPGVRDFTGTAYTYGRSGRTWRRQAVITVPRSANIAGGFGGAVAVAGTGRRVIALISGLSVSGLSTARRHCGRAWEFTRPAGRWRGQYVVRNPKCSSYDEFGYAVAVSGTTAVIGAPGTHRNAGLAWILALPKPKSNGSLAGYAPLTGSG
jgi:hypothetical protein